MSYGGKFDRFAHLMPADVPALKECHAVATRSREDALRRGQPIRAYVMGEERARLAQMREEIRRRFGK